MTPTTVTYTLEEVLSRFDQKIEKQFTEINQKMDKQFAEVNQKMDKQFVEVNQKMDKQFAEVNQKFVEVNNKLGALEIGQTSLNEKVIAINQSLNSQEFINRGVFVGALLAFIGGLAKFFGLLPMS